MSARRYSFLAALLATTTPVLAQDNFDLGEPAPAKKPAPLFFNSIEAGFGYQSRDSFHFARYGGVAEKGPFPIMRGSLQGRDLWSSDGTAFWKANASLIGTDLRDVFLRYGQQGQWQVGAFYKGFTRQHTESAKTPFEGAGTGKLFLPANWVGSNTSLRFTTLEQNLKPLELKTQWQVMGGDVVFAPTGTGYELRFKFQRRTRDGVQASSFAFGHEANFPVGVFFPQPVNYDSHRMSAALSFANPVWQWSAIYELSTFDNGTKSVTVPNPYTRSLGPPWPAGAFAGYPFAFGQYSLPPDNTAHQVSLTGGVALSPKTRLTGKLSYAIQKQNDAFFPYTVNSNLSVPQPLPRSSLNGTIAKTFLSIGLTSREWNNVELSANYTYDDRDNRTARELYSYVPNDVQDQVSAALRGVSRYIRYNLPRSFRFQKAKAEAAYRITPSTRFTVTYDGDFKSRTYQQLTQSDEHALKAKFLSSFETSSVWASYRYAHRTGSGYVDDASWNASHTDNYLNASPLNQSIEHPLLRTFNLADRVRHEAKGGASFDLGKFLTVNTGAGLARETYPHTTYGRQKSRSLILDGDLSYAVRDGLTASAFYSVERYKFDQAGYYIASTNLNNPNQVWGAQNKDTVRSLGAKVDWQALPQKLKFSTAYYLSRGFSQIDVQATPVSSLAVVAPVPDSRENTHNIQVRADYHITPETVVKLGYTFEHHLSRDWQYDSVSIAPVAQILGSGIVPPRYTVHVASMSVAYQF